MNTITLNGINPVINKLEENIIFATDPVVAHCCNTKNTMNSGVAKALRNRFPEVAASDKQCYLKYSAEELIGHLDLVPVVTNKEITQIQYIANLYGQPNYGRDKRYLNYEAFYRALETLRDTCLPAEVASIGMPYYIGCHRAGGHWPVVYEMIKHIFSTTKITINLYELK